VKLALDAKCFIDAFNPASSNHDAAKRLFQLAPQRDIELLVSRHTLAQLSRVDDEASRLAHTLPILPHWPIGAWAEQVGTWDQTQGSWDDARRHDDVQGEIQTLAKAGTDIRDRGAYLDALMAAVEAFVTSDKQLAGSGPSVRIKERFGLRVETPQAMIDALGA